MNFTLQIAAEAGNLPSENAFSTWLVAALPQGANDELTIRIVDADESRELNATYRAKDAPTNVLSFPFETPSGLEIDDLDYLGDLVICASVVEAEAVAQNKQPLAHWAHMVVHGVLHLRGFDHQNDAEASIMEAEERRILQQLNFPDPYTEVNA